MGEIKFSDNYRDLCIQSGVNSGFQFEFYCERCHDAWRTDFKSYSSGRASGWLGKATGFLGGIASEAGSAMEGLAESGWGRARDEAFKESVKQAENHFNRCARCFQYVCGRCWNKDKGLCLNCAPDAEVEIEAARARGELEAAAEQAAKEGMSRGAAKDVKSSRQLVCPKCRAETHGAKFCPECGMQMAKAAFCPECRAEVSPGVKFCPECGHKMEG